MTPLHIAAIRGYDEMTNLLLRRGAQTDVKNYTQMRAPLHFACQYNHPRVRYSENDTVLRNQGGSPSEEIVSSLRPNLLSFFTINQLIQSCIQSCAACLPEERRTPARGLNHIDNLHWKKSVTFFDLHNSPAENHHSELGSLLKCYYTVIIVIITITIIIIIIIIIVIIIHID